MLPQVKDKELIILANNFIKENPFLNCDDYIRFLRDNGHGKFKANGGLFKDAEKSYYYVKHMIHDKITEDKWVFHSEPVYQNCVTKENVSPFNNISKRILAEVDDTDISPKQIKKRRIESSSNQKGIDIYLDNFRNVPDYFFPETVYSFPEILIEEMSKNIIWAESTDFRRIKVAGNAKCGKSSFIHHMAKTLDYHYVELNLSNINFYSTDFYIASSKYAENYDKVLFHFKLNDYTSKRLNGFILAPTAKSLKKLVFVLECNDSTEFNNDVDCTLKFPPNKIDDRVRMFKSFVMSEKLSNDLTYEMLAQWTPGFELGDIKCLSNFLNRHEDVITKNMAEIVIKNTKSTMPNLCTESPNVSWDCIGGHDEAIAELKKMANVILDECSSSKPSGAILVGPPGCGKTMIAKALATELKFNFYHVCATDILDKYQGESEKKLKAAFNKVRSCEPCIMFFDEFDGLFSERDDDNSGSKNNIVNVFLTQMDGIQSHKNSRIFILGATNFLSRIDKAVSRTGRMGRHIDIPLPNSAQQRFTVFMAASSQGKKPFFITDMDDEENNVNIIFNKFSQDEYTKGWNHADIVDLISQSENKRVDSKDMFILMSHVQSAYSKKNNEKTKSKQIQSPNDFAVVPSTITEFVNNLSKLLIQSFNGIRKQ